MRNAFAEASEALHDCIVTTRKTAAGTTYEYLEKAESALRNMMSLYSLLLEELSGSEQISQMNLKLENELRRESQEVTRLRNRIQEYVATKEKMSEANTELSADLESYRTKLNATEQRLRACREASKSLEDLERLYKQGIDASAIDTHRRIVAGLESKLESTRRELRNTKDECTKRLASQDAEHTSKISIERNNTELARKQALHAESELEKILYKQQVDQRLIQSLQMVTEQQAKSVQHFQAVMDQHLRDMADLRTQHDRTLEQNTELSRQSQDIQRIRHEHASLSAAAEDAKATIQQLQTEVNTLTRRIKEAETPKGRQDPRLETSSSRKRSNNDGATDVGPQPENHKHLRLDTDQVAGTTLVDRVVSGLDHVASLPPPSLMQRLTYFDLTDDIPEADLERTIEERLHDLTDKHRTLRADYILYNLQMIKTRPEFNPSMQVLLRIGYKYASNESKQELEKSGSIASSAMQVIKMYKESDDPETSEHRRALLHLRVRWGYLFHVPEEWRQFSMYKGMPTMLRALYEKVEELGGHPGHLWQPHGPLLRALKEKSASSDEQYQANMACFVREYLANSAGNTRI